MAQWVYQEADDVDQQAEFLAGYCQTCEQLGRGRFHGRLWQLLTSRGVLFRESTNRQLRQQVRPPADHVALAVPVSVNEGSRFAGRALTPESLMVLTGTEDHELSSSGALDLVGISVRSDLTSSLAQEQQDWLQRATRVRHLVVAPDSAAAMRRTLLPLLESLRQPVSPGSHEARRQQKSVRDTPITLVATELGFNSASHFTRQYRSMFDELPSQTLRSIRQM